MDIYLVGGAVRDRLLSLPVTEQDFVVVGATEQDMVSKGFRAVGRDFPVYLHPDTGEEYALARTERKTGAGHTGFECRTEDVTLEEDLMRRDLTINAIAQDHEGNLIDPWGGIKDLETRTLRHVSAAFQEDPLRVLRVARFAAKLAPLQFDVHPSTLAMMTEMVKRGDVNELTPERVYQEWSKAMLTDAPGVFFQVIEKIGAQRALWPEITSEVRTRFDACANDLPAGDTRTARLLMLVSHEERQAMAARLRMPNLVLRLADAGERTLERWLDAQANSAEGVVELLQEMDAYRNQSWFETLNRFLGAVSADSVSANFWQALLQETSPVSAKDVPAGLKGPAIGSAIRDMRVVVAGAYLSASRATAR